MSTGCEHFKMIEWFWSHGDRQDACPTGRLRRYPAAFPSVIICALLLLIAGIVTPARAHTPSEMFLTFFVSGNIVTGQWDVAQRDLEVSAQLASAKWSSLPADQQDLWLEGLAIDTVARLEVTANGRKLAFRVTDLEPMQLSTGHYQRVKFTAAVTHPITALEINSSALFGVDTNARGLLRVEHAGRTETEAFTAARPMHGFTLIQPNARWPQLWTFIREGVGHIWQGPDHILFLLALLLPAVLRHKDGRWREPDALRPATVRILKIVTAFTLAHSVTLSLAALDWVRLPARLVEPLIAASIIAAALNNLRPWFGGREWIVALGFGLVHGFGLAGGLIEFGLKGESLVLALFGFNVGVELGQMTIVAIFLPLAFVLSRSFYYRTVALKFGSVAVMGVAAVWMAERIFNFKVLPF